MDDPRGWLGLLCLLLAGAGWGFQVSRRGVTCAGLAVTLIASVIGLTLTTDAFLRGHDLPLVLGLTGSLGAATLMVFSRRDGP
ncbi:hypothetical protein [Deinococcus frigens]|uniref:hypothetical protein n=1 Tax=Deinococcus frigens TaxID=249403 RepID=UPI0004955514|nr:hypothetical protein [Deinococcus frigens]